MIVLCEDCYKNVFDKEVYTIVPLTPCVECGRYDDRKHSGVKANAYPNDPRKIIKNTGE